MTNRNKSKGRQRVHLPSSIVERLPRLFVKLSMLFVGDERPDSRVDEPRSDPESFCEMGIH